MYQTDVYLDIVYPPIAGGPIRLNELSALISIKNFWMLGLASRIQNYKELRENNMEIKRVLLVDDHVLFRRGITSLLNTRRDIEIVGEASNGLEAVAKAKELTPDLILMDVNMPTCDGIEAVKMIRQEMSDVQIVMLTISEDDDDLFEAIKNGAQGYLLKNLDPHQLFEMLEGLEQGEAAISRAMATKILHEFKEPQQQTHTETEPVDALTSREIEVLEQVVTGATNSEIAEILDISANTVKIHLRNILEKLHLKNRVQAAVYAIREGLLDENSVSPSPVGR